jgi:hypothetical protein
MIASGVRYTALAIGYFVALPLGAASAQGRAWVPGPLMLDSTRYVQLRDRPGARWIVRRTPHLALYADSGSYAANHLDSLSARAEREYTHVLELLGLSQYPHQVELFYFESAAALQAATRRSGTGGGFPEAQTVFLVVNAGERVPDDAHELAHVLSLTTWGLNRADDVWLREGLGVLAQPECWPASLTELAAAVRREGDSRRLAELAGAAFYAGDRDARFRAYIVSAAFVEHLRDRFGIEKLAEFWRHGPDSAERVFGAPLATLEAQWASALPVRAPSVAKIDLVAAQRAGCKT